MAKPEIMRTRMSCGILTVCSGGGFGMVVSTGGD